MFIIEPVCEYPLFSPSYDAYPSQYYSYRRPQQVKRAKQFHETTPSTIRTIPITSSEQRKAQQQARQQLVERRNKAARSIQRWFRKVVAKRRHKAALILQRQLRNYLVCKSAKKLAAKLKQLEAIRSETVALNHRSKAVLERDMVFEDDSANIKFLANRDLLGYEDALCRLLLKVDAVDSEGHDLIRERRKSLASFIQAHLDQVDRFREDQVGKRLAALEAGLSDMFGDLFQE